ncbi:MAG: Aerobic respiration control sensor protein ArcB [Gammaproteobacteria bacterium]|jgi:DNA-binding CsgD family transcriptional regulator|nr:Aerobic respiration control sensor protein ArcB [Gammaproteobacteria bacterium]
MTSKIASECNADDNEIKTLINIIKKQKTEIFQLRSVLENLPGSIYWKDKNGIYLGRNTFSMEKMQSANLEHNLEKDAVIGKTDYDFFPKEVADAYRKNDLEVMNKGIEITSEEGVSLPDGSKLIQLSSKRPLHDEKNNIIGVIGNTVDITHLKKIEAELREAKETAEEALRAKEIAEQKAKEKSLDLQMVLKDFTQVRYYLSGKYKGVYLTKREAECLTCLTMGLTNKEIAKLLKTSHRTVESQLQIVKQKFGCKGRSELIKAAIECSFLEGIKPNLHCSTKASEESLT